MKCKGASYGLGVVALSLLLPASTSAATLARQCGAFGIVAYDPAPELADGYVARQYGAFGIVTYDLAPEPADGYVAWAAEKGITGAWNEMSGGIYNVFRYVFGQPTGAITNPPLIDIEIEGGNAVVITPPVSNTVGFTISVVESSDVAGAAVTRRKPLDATGRTVFPMGSAASRFYRLSAAEGDAEPDPGGVQLWENGPYWDAN